MTATTSEPLPHTSPAAAPSASDPCDTLELERQWLKRAAAVCEQASRGDLERRLLDIDVGGDVGRILHAINSLLDYTEAFMREVKAVLSYAAQDKFYRRVALRGMNGAFRQSSELINAASAEMKRKSDKIAQDEAQRLAMADAFEQTVMHVANSVSQAADQVQATAASLARSARQTSQRSASALDNSNQSVENVRHVAQLTDDLRGSLSQIDVQVGESNEIVKRAVAEVDQAAAMMDELARSSASIDTVVETIAGITKQTQLLSLNAAIEAARAGAAGAGFAIVAAEVRKLAERTRNATEEVKQEIGRVQSSSANVVRSIGQCGETVGELNNISSAIAELVGAQRTGTASIHANVAEVSARSQCVNDCIQQTSAGAVEAEEAATQLLASAHDLTSQAGALSEGVDKMLVQIRSR